LHNVYFIFDETANSKKLECQGVTGKFLGFSKGHYDKIEALNTKDNVIHTAGYGDVRFNETNTQALISDLDINDEVHALDLIHSSTDLVLPDKKEANAAGLTADDDISSPPSVMAAASNLPELSALTNLVRTPFLPSHFFS